MNWATAERIAFIDSFTTWCGPCKIDNSEVSRTRLREALERAGQVGLAGEIAGQP